MRPKISISALFALLLALSVPFISVGSRQAAGQQPLPYPASKTSHRRTVVPIERSPHFGAILVRVHVNGKLAVLILDTGSNTTILSPEISGLNPAHLPRADPPRKGTCVWRIVISPMKVTLSHPVAGLARLELVVTDFKGVRAG